MKFAAKMKSKAWDREADNRRALADMSEDESMALMLKVGVVVALLPVVHAHPDLARRQYMKEEAELSKGLTPEQNNQRIKMEKIGWEQVRWELPSCCAVLHCAASCRSVALSDRSLT